MHILERYNNVFICRIGYAQQLHTYAAILLANIFTKDVVREELSGLKDNAKATYRMENAGLNAGLL